MADKDMRPGPLPAEVLAYWRAKRLKPTFDYRDTWLEEHDYAFSAAKIMREDVLELLHQELDRAIAEGTPFDRWVRDIQPRLERAGWWAPQDVTDPETGRTVEVDPPSRLRRIYQTNMRTAHAVGQWDRLVKNKRTKPYWLYEVGPSERHRPLHLTWHGLLLPQDDPFWQYAFPPSGWGCFLPGTRVTGTIVGGSKAFYSGEAIELTTESGATLSVTPNHPIATTRGWLSARSVSVGDDCVSQEFEILRPYATPSRAVRDDQIPTSVEDVFDALASHGGRFCQASPLDFHGEAQRFIGKVHVVGTYVELVHRFETELAQFARHGLLAGTNAALVLKESARLRVALGSGGSSSGRGFPGSAAKGNGLGSAHPPPALERSFGHRSRRQTMATKKLAEGGAAHSAFIRELLHRSSGQVSLDKVVRVRRFPYVGHVYDLESESGWIFADGIVASNCKCHVRGVSNREADQLDREGILVPDPEPELDDEGNPTGHKIDRRIAVVREAPPANRKPWKNDRTGKIEMIPEGVDPGFQYPPGQGRKKALPSGEK